MNFKLDALTQVYSRDAFFIHMDKLIAEGKKFALMLLDVDNFKYINDYYGHLTGDKVLQAVANRMKEVLSQYGMIGRYGGDEFLALLEDIDGYDEIWQICHTMMNKMNEPFKKGDTEINASATIGLSRFPQDANNATQLFECADKALYRGKTKGRNCFIIYLEEKHKNLDLKGENEKRFSSMYLHTHVFRLLTHTPRLNQGVADTLNFLSEYFMIDHVCLAMPDKLLFETYHQLASVRKCKPIDFKYIYANINDPMGLYYENNTSNLPERSQTEFYDMLVSQNIKSTVYVKIEAYQNFYGFLRADVVSSVRGRIWQSNELDIMIGFAHNLALILNSRKLSLEDLI